MSRRTLGFIALLLILMPLLAMTCSEDERYQELAAKRRDSNEAEAKFQAEQPLHELSGVYAGIGFPVLGCLALALFWFTRPGESKKSESHSHHHRCRKCGYDCRATPVKCPECGNVLPGSLANTPTPPRPKL
jgi:hypothetical protein